MNLVFKKVVCLATIGVAVFFMSSCTTHHLPNIEVDILNVEENEGTGLVKKTIKENSVVIYVDTLKSDLSDMSLTYTVSEDATFKFVTPNSKHEETGDDIDPSHYDDLGTVPTDYTQPVYVCVTAARGVDPATNKIWSKVWKVSTQVLTENMPTKFTFDNWETPTGCYYQMPYDVITEGGKQSSCHFWDSTCGSLTPVWSYVYGQYLNYTNFGSQPTDDAVSGKALKLVTSDIEWADPRKPRVAGCLFMGVMDNENTDDQLKTRVGMPFNKKPKTLKFYYKYKIPTGLTDDGYIRVVLFKTDDTTQYLTGYTIKDNNFENVVAYAELRPSATTKKYKLEEIPFTYTKEVSEDDLQDWKYSLAIYFASSYKGFEYGGAAKFDLTTGTNTGSELYIDDFEIVCE